MSLSLDILMTTLIGLTTFFVALLFILYRQITFVGKTLFEFRTKVYEDFTINDEINRRLEISQQLVDEKLRVIELEVKHLEERQKND